MNSVQYKRIYEYIVEFCLISLNQEKYKIILT